MIQSFWPKSYLKLFHYLFWSIILDYFLFFSSGSLSKTYQPMDKDLACDIHIINLRTMMKSSSTLKPSNNVALILHRQVFFYFWLFTYFPFFKCILNNTYKKLTISSFFRVSMVATNLLACNVVPMEARYDIFQYFQAELTSSQHK